MHTKEAKTVRIQAGPWQMLEDAQSDETIAGLRIMVYFARRHGAIKPEERTVLEDLFETMVVPGCPDLETLMNEKIDLDEQLQKIKTPDGRDRAYNAVFCLAHVEGDCAPEQQALLDR